MDKIKSLRVKNPDGTISEDMPLNIDGINVDLSNGHDLETELNIIHEELNTIPSIVTELNENSTDSEVPSAKCVYDLLGDIESLLDDIIGEDE